MVLYKTTAGTFNVSIKDDAHLDQETRKIKTRGTSVSVGAKNVCVFINIPLDSKIAFMYNLKTKDGGCEHYDNPIKREKTVIMVKLALTLLKEKIPSVTHVELDDMSDFTCILPNGSKVGIALSVYELLLRNKTWYERHFNAYIKNDQDRENYLKAKEGFLKEKPADYNFKNTSLDEILKPIFKDTATWKEFLAKIDKREDKCSIMYPWYRDLLKELMGGKTYERLTWVIDLDDGFEKVPYTLVYSGGKGTRRNKQKRIKYMVHPQVETENVYDYLMYNEINDISYAGNKI